MEKLRLETNKLRLEADKLRLEANELGRPQWRRAAVLIPGTVAVISTATVWIQWSTSSWKADKAAYELSRASAAKDSVERDRRRYEQHIQRLRNDSTRLVANNALLQHSVEIATAGERRALTQGNGALSAAPSGAVAATTPGTSAELVTRRQEAIAGLFAESPAARGRAYDILIGQYADDPDLVPALIAYANARRAQLSDRAVQNGFYNTLVLLSHLNRNRLAPHAPALRAFAASVRGLGYPKISERVDVLLSRLPEA